MRSTLLGAVSATALLVAGDALAINALHDGTARGFGQDARGGRGDGSATPTIYRITSLSNSGAGTLRECMEAAGPRFCVPTVAGVIELTSPITVNDDFLSVFGGFAPGKGIFVKLADTVTSNGGPVRILGNSTTWVKDVIIQHVRFGPGLPDCPTCPNGAYNPSSNDSFLIENAEDVLLDHLTVAWSTDENFNVHNKADDITLQYSISAESLNDDNHSKGALICSLDASADCGNVSLHKNLFISNNDRNPDIKSKSGLDGYHEVTNNYVYNYRAAGAEAWDNGGDGVYMNFQNNVYDPGPMTLSSGAYGLEVQSTGLDTQEIYVNGNSFLGLDSNVSLNPAADQVDAAQYTPTKAGTLTAATSLWSHLKPRVGTLPNNRTTTEIAWIGQVDNQNGPSALLVEADVTWPTISPGTARADADSDGCPDAQEVNLGTNVNAADQLADQDADGYLNIEDCNDLLTP